MYLPHTVSLMNVHKGLPCLALLRGVMLQALSGRSVQRRGDTEENEATLYIPLSVRAENGTGESLTFLPPLEYARCAEPEKHWTLQPEGESAGRSSFFFKGEIQEACSRPKPARSMTLSMSWAAGGCTITAAEPCGTGKSFPR